MDPAFDKPPDLHYTCTICNANGKHYKSLCPKNSDPFSIIQRRKDQGLKTFSVVPRSSSRDTIENEELLKIRQFDRDYARLSRDPEPRRSISPLRKSTKFHPWVSPETAKDTRHHPEQSAKVESSYGRLSRKRSLSISPNRDPAAPVLRNERAKFRRTEEGASEMREKKKSSTKTDETIQAIEELLTEGRENGAAILDNDSIETERQVSNPDEIDLGSDHDYASGSGDNVVEDTPGLDTSIPTRNSIHISYSSSDSSDGDIVTEAEVEESSRAQQQSQRSNKFSDFVQKLIQSQEEMKEIVNKIPKRPSAAVMWRRASQRRRESTITE
jgi:hypothetical protein